MKRLVFSASTMRLGDLTPLIEVARTCAKHFEPVFVPSGYLYNDLIKQAGFPIAGAVSYFNPATFSLNRLRQRIRAEILLWRRLKPAAIVNKHSITTVISAQAAGIPLIWLLPFPWSRPCFDAGLVGDNPLDLIRHWFRPGATLPTEKMYLTPFQMIANEVNASMPDTLYDLFEGEYTLLTEIPDLTDIPSLPPTYHYVGPCFARLESPIPEAIRRLPRGKPIVYFALGSSGNRRFVKEMIEGFAQRPFYHVIAPVKSYLRQSAVTVPDNVTLTEWLPAHKVNPLADLSVICGGQGTVHTACLSGTPFVGIGMHKEQEINIDFIVRKGCAIRLDKETVTPQSVLQALDSLLHNESARRQAKNIQNKLKAWDGPANVTRFLCQTFGF
jgi:UDP:flavonoid glycosyltransferase YjiC (YdhE family)